MSSEPQIDDEYMTMQDIKIAIHGHITNKWQCAWTNNSDNKLREVKGTVTKLMSSK